MAQQIVMMDVIWLAVGLATGIGLVVAIAAFWVWHMMEKF